MKKKVAETILREHLKKHCLNLLEEIIAMENIEDSIYYCHKYKISNVKSSNKYWLFTLGNQSYFSGFGHSEIGGPLLWYVDKKTGHCIRSTYINDEILYEKYIIKHKIYEARAFYSILNPQIIKDDNIFKAINLWYRSNVLDEYCFLCLLKVNVIEKLASKSQFLYWYHYLKKNRILENTNLIEQELNRISFKDSKEEINWKRINAIINLSSVNKLRMHRASARLE